MASLASAGDVGANTSAANALAAKKCRRPRSLAGAEAGRESRAVLGALASKLRSTFCPYTRVVPGKRGRLAALAAGAASRTPGVLAKRGDGGPEKADAVDASASTSAVKRMAATALLYARA